MLTVFEDDDKIFRSLKARASRYMLKKTLPAQLVEAIKDLSKDCSQMNAQIVRKVVALFQHTEQKTKPQNVEGLTKREIELLELLSRGFRYKEIAKKLFISSDTLCEHITETYMLSFRQIQK